MPQQYVLKTLVVAAAFFFLQFGIILAVPSPIEASYWVREMLVLKQHFAQSTAEVPRLLFLGGSATLFGIDAKTVSAELGMPAINFGLNADLPLDRLLAIADNVTRPGDILVLPLEQEYYDCSSRDWYALRLRNFLAWDRAYFSTLPVSTRLWAIFSSAKPDLAREIISDRIWSGLYPEQYSERLAALGSPDEIYVRYSLGVARRSGISYWAYNIDDHGDATQNIGSHYTGIGVSPLRPAKICPAVLSQLKQFVAIMKSRHVRVLIAHSPYLTDKAPDRGWINAEALFSSDIRATGAEILDRREDLFLPRKDFFDTYLHLNEPGRKARTETLVAALRMLDVGSPAHQ